MKTPDIFRSVSLKTKYILFVSIIHGVIIFLTFRLLRENKLYFILSELFILISLGISIKLYQDFIQPLKFLLMGAEAIKDQDFAIKFRPVGRYEMDELINVYNSMIERLRAERLQVEEQHFFLEKLIQASPIAIIILDFDDNLLKTNPKAQDLLDLPEQFAAMPLAQINHPIIPHLLLLENGTAKTVQPNGLATFKLQRSFFMDKGFARPFIMIEELTAEILETEKKAYGKVIRMMAHEVNNSIGAVNSILEVTKKYIDNDDLLNALQVARERNHRLNYFMRRFADIVRLPLPHKENKNIADVVKNAVSFMKLQAESKGISMQMDGEKEVMLLADIGQMEQVLVNILKNAIEACEAENQILIHIDSSKLVIKNNGKPIPADIEHRLFTPFFSNKPDGQGIGLMLIREILNNHGFDFSLQTHADNWTVFEISLVNHLANHTKFYPVNQQYSS